MNSRPFCYPYRSLDEIDRECIAIPNRVHLLGFGLHFRTHIARVQYLIPNAYSIGMILSLLIFAVGFGIVFAWTRSLVPSMMAHAIINFPMTPFWQVVLLVGFVVVLFIARRRGAAVTRQVFSNTSGAVCSALALLGAAYAIIAARLDVLMYLAAAMLAIAVFLEAFEKSRNRHHPLSQTGLNGN